MIENLYNEYECLKKGFDLVVLFINYVQNYIFFGYISVFFIVIIIFMFGGF